MFGGELIHRRSDGDLAHLRFELANSRRRVELGDVRVQADDLIAVMTQPGDPVDE